MSVEPIFAVTFIFIVVLFAFIGMMHFTAKTLSDRINASIELTKQESALRESLEERIILQFDKYAQCVQDLAAIKVQLLYNIESQSTKQTIQPKVEILGIWPEYDGEIYEKLDQATEIANLSKTTFSFTKLDAHHATREAIVNELSLNPSINVIQIGAHGNENYIALSPNNGARYDLASHDWFAKVLHQYNIKLVLLFVCTSNNLADMLYRNGVDCVLGFRDDVADEQIIRFLKNFYKFLASRKSVSESVRLALFSFNNEISNSIVLRGDYTFDN